MTALIGDETPTQRGARKALDLIFSGRRSLISYTLDPRVRGRRSPRNLLAEAIEALPESERRGALWAFSEVLVLVAQGTAPNEEYLTKMLKYIPEEAPSRPLPARRPLSRQ